MANPKGAVENLRPVRSKEEAKKRGAAGGRKSGEVRRNKRDAKKAIDMVLNMGVTGKLADKLEELGIDPKDMTYLTAMTAVMALKASSGDVPAYRALMEYGGFNPELIRKENESRERAAYAKELQDGSDGPSDTDGLAEDVQIYLPDNGR